MTLGKEALGKLTGSEQHRHDPRFVKEYGLSPAIFASQLLYWSSRGWDNHGWIYKSIGEWKEETGLSRRQQETARRVLVSRGVLEERDAVGPDGRWRKFYRLDFAALLEAVAPEEVYFISYSNTMLGLRIVYARSEHSLCALRAQTMAEVRRLGTETRAETKSKKNASSSKAKEQQSENGKSNNLANGSGRTRSGREKKGSEQRKEEPYKGTPEVGIDALVNYVHPKMGWNDLGDYAPVAKTYDFTSDEPVPWYVLKKISGNEQEARDYADRLHKVTSRAVKAAAV